MIEVERLGEIVVRAGVQAMHARLHGIAGGEDEHGRADVVASCLGKDVQAVLARQAEIQQHEIG